MAKRARSAVQYGSMLPAWRSWRSWREKCPALCRGFSLQTSDFSLPYRPGPNADGAPIVTVQLSLPPMPAPHEIAAGPAGVLTPKDTPPP
jgi:hypothetical protein